MSEAPAVRRARPRISRHHPLPRRRRGSSAAADLEIVTDALSAADHEAADPRITIIPRRQREKAPTRGVPPNAQIIRLCAHRKPDT